MQIKIIPILILTALLIGCSNSASKNPLSPSSPLTTQSASTSNRHIWGIYDITISSDRNSVSISPLRSVEMHLNAINLIESKPCSSCLLINNIKKTAPNELSADLTLIHPYPGLLKYTGFDVRGIFISTADFTFPSSNRKIAFGDSVPRMLNPDGYTSLFNPTEFPPTTPAPLGYIAGKHATGGDLSATMNPFIAYRKDAPRRMFEPGGSETKTVKIHAPSGPIHFGYAVDVCWQLVANVVDPLTDFPPDANCLEAYAISVDIGPGLLMSIGSSAPLNVKIYDHQGQSTISSVTIEAPLLLSGNPSLTFSTIMPDGASLYTGTIYNDVGAASGEYPALVKVTDTQADQNLGEVAGWQIASAIIYPPKGWARTWGGENSDFGNSIAVDGSGNVYVTGIFSDTTDFDPGPGVDIHTSNGDFDIFLSKFDWKGNFIWARTWGGPGRDPWFEQGLSVAIDGSGNAYVSGRFNDTVDFDPGPGVDSHISYGYYNTFLSKFDPNGNFIWARTWGGADFTQGWSVTIDGSGNAYVTGEFHGTVDFDPGPGEDYHTSNGWNDAFLSKFDPNGYFIRARTWGGGGGTCDVHGLSVAVDSSGNAYVTGQYDETVDFNPGPGVDNQTSNGGFDIYLSKLDSNGDYVWARTWGGTSYDEGMSVKVDGSGNAYVTGYFNDTVDFDPGSEIDYHTGSQNGFLSRFDPNGDFIWARTWGDQTGAEGFSVAIDSSGNAYITGHFWASVDFDPGPGVDNHTPIGFYDAFLSKLDSNGIFVWARTWGGPDYDEGSSVAIDGSGNVYISGNFLNTVDFDPGPGVDNHTSHGYIDAFLSKFPPDGDW